MGQNKHFVISKKVQIDEKQDFERRRRLAENCFRCGERLNGIVNMAGKKPDTDIDNYLHQGECFAMWGLEWKQQYCQENNITPWGDWTSQYG